MADDNTAMTVESVPLAQPASGDESEPRFEFSRLVRAMGFVAVLLSLACAATTFFVLMGLTSIEPTPRIVFIAMSVNGGLVAFLILVVAWELIRLLVARWRGQAAAGLHVRIVIMFSFIAAAPAVLLALTASVSLDRGLDNWFSTRTQAIVDNSLSIAQAYAEQQAAQLRIDVSAVKAQLLRAPGMLKDQPDSFATFLTTAVRDRNLSEVFVVDGDGLPVATAQGADRRDVPPPLPEALSQAKARPGNVIIITPGSGTNILGAIAALPGFDGLYLYAARAIDPKVNAYLTMTSENVAQYRTLEATRFGMQIAFGILFLGVTVVVLLSAIWLGIGFANSLVAPIRRLIDAAKEVSHGNLDVRVQPRHSDGDVGALGVTFNTMTAQLRGQREELLAASEQIDARRRFTEAVLSGATAGVVGIDTEGRVAIVNRAALNLFGTTESEAVGAPIGDMLRQLEPVVTTAMREGRPEHRAQIVVPRGGRERTINIRVTTEGTSGHSYGYVITLDDITDLVSAQRSSAWADVARRIAHEIKNPLTPIQLSAERLKRKFTKAISEDVEVFEQCTDTIIRQVGDIGRMVDEFSSFARMPKPAMTVGNLSEAVRESVFVISVSQPEIAFDIDLPDEPLMARFDPRLMAQALTNIVKNATEAIAAVPGEERGQGRVMVSARADDGSIVVDVADNGIGFPNQNRQRLLEPYMTTREKGTGLGLAIVTKIVEEHGGRLELLDAPAVASGGRGALIRIMLPRLEMTGGDGSTAAPADKETLPVG
jgi:two-component system nitrogen regulation sensor histidine kinase NtrY